MCTLWAWKSSWGLLTACGEHRCNETEEWHTVVPAGTVVIVHYELWHRGTRMPLDAVRNRCD